MGGTRAEHALGAPCAQAIDTCEWASAASSDADAPESYVLSLLAEAKYEAAFEVIPEFGSPSLYAPHFCRFGYQLWRAGRPREAVDALRRAARLDAGLASAWLALGMALLSDDAGEEGDRCLARAISLNDGDDGRNAAQRRGADLGLTPGNLATAHYLRGVVARASGSAEEAANHFAACLRADPRHQAAAAELGQLADSRALSAPAREVAERARARARRAAHRKERRATLSACLITRDEAEPLSRCLSSVRQVADQIVVVDTGSRDGTVEVARRFGAEVHEMEWRDDFAAARNAAIAHASEDWILILDADEELPAASAAQLAEMLSRPISASVCRLMTHAPVAGTGRYGIDLVGHLRLFRNRQGFRFRGAIHEQLCDQDGKPVESALATDIAVYHHGYLEAEEAMAERSERNLRIIASECQNDPDNPYLLFHLGQACLGCDEAERAAEALRHCLELSGPDHAFRGKAGILLTLALIASDGSQAGESVAREMLLTYPANPELLSALGCALEAQGRVAEATQAYEAATRGRFGPAADYHDFACRDATPRGRLAVIHLSQGEAQKAVDWLLPALVVRPEASHLQRMLAAAYLALEDHRKAREELGILLRDDPEDAMAHNMLGVSLAQCSEHDDAVRHFQRALARRPEDSDILCNLGASQQALGNADRARDCFEQVLKCCPHRADAWLGLARSYLDLGCYSAAVRGYEMAVQASGRAPQVMAEVAAARDTLAGLARHKHENRAL